MDQEQAALVEARLRAAGIPLEQWGTGKAKTLGHLLKEIDEGETVVAGEGSALVRRISALSIAVQCTANGRKYELLEDRQVFTDGRERKRGSKGVKEKLKPGEDLLVAVHRALREELSVGGPKCIVHDGTRHERTESPSYPGLVTMYVFHDYTVQLDHADYRPDGYMEKQGDKTTYFVWSPLPT